MTDSTNDAILREMPHVVWNVTFWDVEDVLFRHDPDEDTIGKSRPQGEFWVAEQTEAVVADAALTLGLSLDSCGDDDEVDDVRYYEWRFKVPQSEHRRTDRDGVPVLVKQMQGVIAQLLPQARTRWEFSVDDHLTWCNFMESAVREDYADLLTPLEACFRDLLPADEEVGWQDAMQVQTWGHIETTQFCTTTIPIGEVPSFMFAGRLPSGESQQARLEIGMRPSEEHLLDQHWANVAQFGFDSGNLFTPIPRPKQGLLIVRAHGYEAGDRTHEWFGRDAAGLAHEVVEVHRRDWFPKWFGQRGL